jgi:hypothetical protein
VDGVRLRMTVGQVQSMTGLEAEPLGSPGGPVNAWRILDKQGFTGGGFFQVSFTREELGRQVFAVVLNRRYKRPFEDLDPVLGEFTDIYGPPDRLCVGLHERHTAYNAWWGAAPPDCSDPMARPREPHLYLNLISGTWVEVFLSLQDPALLEANVEAARKAREEGRE